MLPARKEKLADLTWAAPLVAFYGWNAAKGLRALAGVLPALPHASGALPWAKAAAVLSGTAFSGFLVAVLLTRMPPSSGDAGWRPRLTAFLGTFSVVGFQSLPLAPLTAPWALASALLIGVGFLLSLAVLRRLGPSFSVVPEARRLETGGLYAVCRHPLYLVEQAAILGYCLLYVQPWSALLMAAEVALQLMRIRDEERVLTAAFPEYAAYAARTARLIPGLY